MANYCNGREAFYCWNSSYYCTRPFGVEDTGTVQLMAGSVTSTLSPEIYQMMMAASPQQAQFTLYRPMMISPRYFVSAPFPLLSTMVTLNPGTFQPQPYIPQETQLQNTFQTLQIRDEPESFVASQCAPAPVFVSPFHYQTLPGEYQFFPSSGNILFADMTVPRMIDQGTQWVLLPLSEWASAPAQVQQQVLREMIESRYATATGPSLYSQMKALAAAGKLGRQGKPCGFCVSNKETDFFARSHVLRDHSGIVRCPVLRRVTCRVCLATGDNAHTAQYCPLKRNEGEGVTGGSCVKGNLPKRSRYARKSAGKQYVRKY